MRSERRRLALAAHDILRDQGRAREVYRTEDGDECCLVGAFAIAWENLHGKTLLVPERVNGVDVYVFDDEGKAEEALRPAFELVVNALPERDANGEYLDYGDLLRDLLLFNDNEDVTDAAVLRLLKEVAA